MSESPGRIVDQTGVNHDTLDGNEEAMGVTEGATPSLDDGVVEDEVSHWDLSLLSRLEKGPAAPLVMQLRAERLREKNIPTAATEDSSGATVYSDEIVREVLTAFGDLKNLSDQRIKQEFLHLYFPNMFKDLCLAEDVDIMSFVICSTQALKIFDPDIIKDVTTLSEQLVRSCRDNHLQIAREARAESGVLDGQSKAMKQKAKKAEEFAASLGGKVP